MNDFYDKRAMKRFERMAETAGSADESSVVMAKVHLCIEERIGSSPYAFHFSNVTWRYADGILTLQGRVATFHLKQMLQTMLRDIKNVQRLLNEVEVIGAAFDRSRKR